MVTISEITRSLTVPAQTKDALAERFHKNWHIFENGELNKKNLATLLEVLNKKLGYHSTDIELETTKKGALYLEIKENRKNKRYFIAESADTKEARLLKALSVPHLRIRKSVESVYEYVYGEEGDDPVKMKKRLVGTVKEMKVEYISHIHTTKIIRQISIPRSAIVGAKRRSLFLLLNNH